LWLDNSICGEPILVPLYHSRRDGPHEDCDSKDAEDYEGHIGTWSDPNLTSWNANTWTQRWGLRPLLNGPLVCGLELHNLISLPCPQSARASPCQTVEGAILSTTSELILRRASAWKVSMLLFNSEFRRLRRRTFSTPGTSNYSTSKEALPSARQLHEGQQEQICHGLLFVAYSQGNVQGGHRGISRCRAYPRGYRCLLQLPVKTTEAKEHVCPHGFDEGLHGFAEVSSVYFGACLGSS
jgi:hypothetical protein